jgi:hypothetical protein
MWKWGTEIGWREKISAKRQNWREFVEAFTVNQKLSQYCYLWILSEGNCKCWIDLWWQDKSEIFERYCLINTVELW